MKVVGGEERGRVKLSRLRADALLLRRRSAGDIVPSAPNKEQT